MNGREVLEVLTKAAQVSDGAVEAIPEDDAVEAIPFESGNPEYDNLPAWARTYILAKWRQDRASEAAAAAQAPAPNPRRWGSAPSEYREALPSAPGFTPTPETHPEAFWRADTDTSELRTPEYRRGDSRGMYALKALAGLPQRTARAVVGDKRYENLNTRVKSWSEAAFTPKRMAAGGWAFGGLMGGVGAVGSYMRRPSPAPAAPKRTGASASWTPANTVQAPAPKPVVAPTAVQAPAPKPVAAPTAAVTAPSAVKKASASVSAAFESGFVQACRANGVDPDALVKAAQDVNGNGPEYGRAMLANQTPPTPGQERMRNDVGFLRDTARGGWRYARQQVRGGMQAAAQGVRNAAANAYVGVNKATGGGLSRAVGAMYPAPKQQAAPATAPAQAPAPAATNGAAPPADNATSANSTRPEGVKNPIIKAAAWVGFVDACRLEGVDPEQLIKAASFAPRRIPRYGEGGVHPDMARSISVKRRVIAPDDFSQSPDFVKRLASVGIKPGTDLFNMLNNRFGRVGSSSVKAAAYGDKDDDKPGFMRRTVGGGIKGSIAGAAVGGAYGAGNAALNLRRLSQNPVASKMLGIPTSDSKEMLKLYLSQMLGGAKRTVGAGAQWGGLIGAATGAAR